ncbi:DUF1572 family protein [Flammeovirga sp. SJP92]|uniref:DUF1572 family protein n=1 Tax=Flammeovirga sp. SJP92 TaxID=1775430 RepID=UPI000788F615|nr:DUF1572 family protein [Flammeovirga sp. SJP92]KXX66755.1 hypothetical protein AVL50_29930 [Flammeovirga sp. SJP92]
MTNSKKVADRLREVMLNGTWIANTNFKKALKDVDYNIANSKVEPLNTIAILAQHIHYYIHGIKNVFEGGELEIKDKFSFDFPPITSQQQWETFLERFWEDAERLAVCIEGLSDEDLEGNFVKKEYGSYQRNVDGMIEHAYYHLGQVILIKKMLSFED